MVFGSVLGPLEDFIRQVLYFIHDHTPLSWAWSIIALTVIVRICLVPLTVKQMKSMQKMQQFQPEIKKLQQQYSHDRQLMNQKMMEFYKENQINPFGSCLPLVLQLPVFFALFFVLQGFARHPPPGDLGFLGGFVDNITRHTNQVGVAGIVLIVLYVLSQIGSTLLMPTTMDKTQRYLFMAMPLFFVFFVIRFPVGLMLYWITTNLWTVGQQAVIRKVMPPPPGAMMPSFPRFGGGGSSPAKPKPKPKPSSSSGSGGKRAPGPTASSGKSSKGAAPNTKGEPGRGRRPGQQQPGQARGRRRR